MTPDDVARLAEGDLTVGARHDATRTERQRVMNRCTSNVNIPAVGGSGIVVWCKREPHYGDGPHRASVIGQGHRAGDHEGNNGRAHRADVTVEWVVE